MKHVRIIAYEIPGAIPMMRIRIENGDPLDAVTFPQDVNGQDHVIETAVPTKEIPSRVMAAGTDECEGIADFPGCNLLCSQDNAAGGMPRRGTEGIPFDAFKELTGVHLQDELLGNAGRLVETKPGVIQEGF
jgi:hypothetical protein